MSGAVPIACRWEGDVFRVLPRSAAAADREFVIGEAYVLEVVEERSTASHKHYFATIREAWMNLPFEPALQFPTPETLRKYALIKAGYADVEHHVCEFKTEAQRLALALRPHDDYAIVSVEGKVVTVYRAKSQSLKAMGKADFQASKDAVLAVISDMLGVTPAELQSARAA